MIPLALIAAPLIKALSGHGLSLLGDLVRRGSDAAIETVEQKIKETTGIDLQRAAEGQLAPQQWAKLQEFELNHAELILRELEVTTGAEIDRLKLTNENTADARDMQEKAMQSEDWWTRNFVSIYALLVTLGTFAFFFIVLGTEMVFNGEAALSAAAESKVRIVDTVMGFLLGVSLSAIIQFYFGSSAGSSRKTDTIERLLEPEDRGGR
jgi:hypothetical protein